MVNGIGNIRLGTQEIQKQNKKCEVCTGCGKCKDKANVVKQDVAGTNNIQQTQGKKCEICTNCGKCKDKANLEKFNKLDANNVQQKCFPCNNCGK